MKPAEVGKLTVLHAKANASYADQLRRLAARIDAEDRPIRAYAAIIVYADGSIGSEYAEGPAYAPLVGGLALLQQRILHDWWSG